MKRAFHRTDRDESGVHRMRMCLIASASMVGVGVCRIQRVINLVGIDEDAVGPLILLLGGRHAGSQHLDFPFNFAHTSTAVLCGFAD